jgi:hypothetical protein
MPARAGFKAARLRASAALRLVQLGAAYDAAVSLWPKAVIELRQGARVVQKSGE